MSMDVSPVNTASITPWHGFSLITLTQFSFANPANEGIPRPHDGQITALLGSMQRVVAHRAAVLWEGDDGRTVDLLLKLHAYT